VRKHSQSHSAVSAIMPRARRTHRAYGTRLASPLASLLLLGAVCAAQAQDFNYTGAIQTYTIPVSGVYQIVALGADGGTGVGASGGSGVSITGNVLLSAGTVVDIVVGGAGKTGIFGSKFGGGGGGGAFIYVPSALQPLLVAGGGGGAGYVGGNGGAGQTGTSGQDGFSNIFGSGGAGGTGGSGGQGGSVGPNNGGGGAGWLGNGTDGAGNVGGFQGSGGGGFGPPTFAGGIGATDGFNRADGGFGGGGGGGFEGGGGGGGYSGGGGGISGSSAGGGGGSYLDASFTDVTFGLNGTGNGSVNFSLVQGSAVPEPGTFALLGGMAVPGLLLLRRRRA
jgi:hypothetical protein